MYHAANHVLVPVDFSEDSKMAMKTALEYFGEKADTITILTVYEGSQKNAAKYEPDNEVDSLMAKSANIEMTRFKREFSEAYPDIKEKIKTIITRGNPAGEIISTAKSISADLIMMGSQGRNSLASVFFGGTTYQVSRKAHCSVYVIRS